MVNRSRFTKHRGPVTTQGLAFGRSRWRDLAAEARKVSQIIVDGGEPDVFAWSSLKHALNQTGRSGLPVEILGQSATHAPIAFVAAAKGLVVAAGERRSSFARMLLEAARLVEAMLDEAATIEADRTWRRQFPNSD